MALKKRDVQEKSKLLETLKRDYRWENLFLGLIAIVASAIAVMILNKTLTISPDFPVLGHANNGIIFAWILLVISILGILLVILPYLIASAPEIKRISWSHGRYYFDNATRVFIFIIIVGIFMFLCDVIIKEILGKIA